MVFHECGHALAGWMTGQFAVPTYGFTLLLGQSNIFLLIFLVLSAGAVYYFKAEGYLYLALFFLSLIVFSLITFIFAKNEFTEVLFNVGGFLGEIIFSTFLICGYYYEFPKKIRWDFFRYVVVLFAFVVLFKSHETWLRAKHSPSHLPMSGSILSETDKSDTEKILASHFWNGRTLPVFLVKLHNLSLILIVGHFIWTAAFVAKKNEDLDTAV